MDIATSFSILSDSNDAIIDAINKLDNKIEQPALLLMYFTENYQNHILQMALKNHYPNTPFLSSSTCQGLMTNEGYIKKSGLALWAISDKTGAYGTAIVSNHESQSVFYSAQKAISNAIENSGRIGELPILILLHATPGYEEETIQGIESIVGHNVVIIGGSAADNSVGGNWKIFNQTVISTEGIGIAVFYPDCEVSFSFHSGYIPTDKSAVATKVKGREVVELDNKPAAIVYQNWIEKKFDANNSIINESTLNPLGRLVGEVHGYPCYKLAHPIRITKDKGLTMFASIIEGEQLYFMSGTDERLITRAGRVIESTVGNKSNIIGGITIYCAGCMLKVKSKMSHVSEYINQAMNNHPFICPFTFGEQGKFISGENAHGNLMISAVVFHKDE